MKKKLSIFQQGMSLLEVMVVITIFAILGILVTQSVILTLEGSRKSESVVRSRENLDYSLSIIERQIRGASGLYADSGYITQCTGADAQAIYYLDQNGQPGSFVCGGTIGSPGSYIASGAAQLTSDMVKIADCHFHCYSGTSTSPAYATIDVTVQDASASGIESANVSASTEIYLRNF